MYVHVKSFLSKPCCYHIRETKPDSVESRPTNAAPALQNVPVENQENEQYCVVEQVDVLPHWSCDETIATLRVCEGS